MRKENTTASSLRVLVIDDSEITRAQLRDQLEHVGMTVFEQPSGIGATRQILQNQVDAAVVDVSMPGLSGDKLVGVLRKNPRLKDLIIVVISARSTEELNVLSIGVDANAFMSKERVHHELVPLLNKLARRRASVKPARPSMSVSA